MTGKRYDRLHRSLAERLGAEENGAAVILPAPLPRRHEGADLTAWFDHAETPAGAVRIGLAGILRVLRHRGMLGGRVPTGPKRPPLLARSSSWLRAPGGGMLRTLRRDGQVVAKGDLMALVASPFGGEDLEIRAPNAGIIVGQAVMPVVNEGDAVFHLAEIERQVEGIVAEDVALHLSRDPLFDEDEII